MSHPRVEEWQQKRIDENPFRGMLISDSSGLKDLGGRYPCPKCSKSRKYFCYTCFTPVEPLNGKIPHITLPIQIDVIKHRREIDGKSTAAHAAILSPEHVKIYTYPDIPNYDENDTVLVFPSHTALEVHQLFSSTNFKDLPHNFNIEFPKGHNRSTLLKDIPKDLNNSSAIKFTPNQKLPIRRAIFIDSTWNQSRGIYKNENIRKMPCIVLQNRISQFWRHQKGSPRWYLATIEAIHQLLLELHINNWGVHPTYEGLINCFNETKIRDFVTCESDEAYNGQYDDLLFFFKHMYDLIHDYYDHDNLHAYKRRLL